MWVDDAPIVHPLRSTVPRRHRQHVGLLHRWRPTAAEGSDQAAALQTCLPLTVNAIAAGLGSTG
jgi:phosphoenolpyruvate carboxylase